MPTQEQIAFDQGYQQGVIATHTAAIRSGAKALLLYEASQLAASLLSSGVVSATVTYPASLAITMLGKWIKALRKLLEPVMVDAAAPQEPILGVGFSLDDPFQKKFFEDYTKKVAGEIVDGSKDALKSAVEAASEKDLELAALVDQVRREMEKKAATRAQRIAFTELKRAANGAVYLQVAGSGFYPSKTHHHQGDDRVRDEHHFVETVAIDQRYQNGELFSGELSVNCRCFDEYEIVG